MENVSSLQQNLYSNTSASEQKKSSEENFTALDKEKLKQDSVELASKADTIASENWLYKKMRSYGIDDPKKKLKSAIYTVLTVLGLAFIGNKLSTPTAKLGERIDDILLKDEGLLSKAYLSVADGIKNFKDKLKDLPKPKFVEDIIDTVKNRPAKMKATMARGYEKGPVGIFATTVKETLEKSEDPKEALYKILKKSDADDLLEKIKSGIDNPEKYYEGLTQKIISHVKDNYPDVAQKSDMEILELLSKNKLDGVDLSQLTQVDMKGGIFDSWWPVNIVNSIGTKIGQIVKHDPNYKMNFCRGNLFDSLIKFNAINSTGAKTLPGKLAQKIITLPTEAVSNFVNDKAGFGLLMTGMLMSTFDDVQDAPKEQKAATINNEIASQTLNWALSMPIAYKILYSGLASLRNLENNSIISKALKQAGKFFGMGLDYYKDGELIKNTNKATGLLGGAIRFAAMMFVISPFISKQISKVTNKIFGKPYDRAEVEKQKQAEEESKKIIPELGISQKELMDKMQKNPEILKKIEQDPALAKKVQENPKALLDLLDGKTEEQKTTPTTSNNQQMSQANKEFLSKRSAIQTPTPQISTPQTSVAQNQTTINSNTAKKPENAAQQETSQVQTNKPKDMVTYIPSSAPAPTQTSSLSQEQQSEYDAQMTRADKVLKNAEKFI